MNLSDQMTTQEVAALVGASIPTVLRYAGTKEGRGMVFPTPTKVSRRLFTWDAESVHRWVNLNGKNPPTRRGRPKGSANKPKAAFDNQIIFDDYCAPYSFQKLS